MRTLKLNHHDAGYYRVEVTPTGKAMKTYVVITTEGSKRLPIGAENKAVVIEIKNDQVFALREYMDTHYILTQLDML
jgi:hypothetical protein